MTDIRKLLTVLTSVASVLLSGCASNKPVTWTPDVQRVGGKGKTTTIPVDMQKVNARTNSAVQQSLTSRDLASILGIYDEVFQIKQDRPVLMIVSYEEIGQKAKDLARVFNYRTNPLLIASRTEGGTERYWINLSSETEYRQFSESSFTPPPSKFPRRWKPSGELGIGRYVIRQWTDDESSTNDIGDLRFKARVVLEVRDQSKVAR